MMVTTNKKPNPGGGGGSTSTTLSTPPCPHSQDRISELPKEILVHILGFLEMDELLIQTSLVSTKWRNLWKFVSTLNFPACITYNDDDDDDDGGDSDGDGDGDGDGGGIRNNVEKYHNFVDHVLGVRDSEATNIRIFKYHCDDSISREGEGYDYLESLHNFIVRATVNQGAQEIQIICSYLVESADNMMIHFNPSIFTSGLLRKFTFQVFNDYFQIQFPRSMCSSCATLLTHLTLCHIRLPEGEDSNAELHLVCPVLETFEMSSCSSEHLKVLDISAPRLNTLSICNVGGMRGGSDFLGGCRIEIRTPNLTSLDYRGDVYVDCFMENLPRIVDAALQCFTVPRMMEQTTSFVVKLLKALSNAKSLSLGGFRSLEVAEDEDLMLPQCRLSHLKHFHIKYLFGHDNVIEFVKFMLKSSVVLEEIIIKTADSPKQSIEENLKQFIREEPSFRRRIIKLEIL